MTFRKYVAHVVREKYLNILTLVGIPDKKTGQSTSCDTWLNWVYHYWRIQLRYWNTPVTRTSLLNAKNQRKCILVKLPWIFPGVSLKVNGAPRNIQGNLTGMKCCPSWATRVLPGLPAVQVSLFWWPIFRCHVTALPHFFNGNRYIPQTSHIYRWMNEDNCPLYTWTPSQYKDRLSHVWGFPCRETVLSLTHWGRVTHICVSKLTIIGSDNGLSPDRRQAIIWTNAGLSLIGPLGTNFSEILIEILKFSFKKMRLKVSSAKGRPFCLGLNELTWGSLYMYW